MNTIDRYIFRELFKISAISIGALTTILYLDKILFLTELIINKGVTFIEVLWMMIYISPAFLALTIPMSVMVASVVTFSQMSSESELVAMKAGGYSFLRLMKPVLIFSMTTYVATNFIMFSALPWGNQSFKKIIYDIVQNRATFDIKPNVFNKDFDNLVMFVQEKESNQSLKQIFIADSTKTEVPKIIVANEGVIVSDPDILKIQLKLNKGTIHELSGKRRHYQMIKFDRYDLTLDLPRSQDLQRRAMKGNREMSYTELMEKINIRKERGESTNLEEVELSKKFSIPFTCMLFAFIGAPLGVQSSRSGKSGSFAVSTLVILLYYVGLTSTQNLGTLGALPPLISVWIPNLIAFAAGLYLVIKMHKEIPFKFYNYLEDMLVIAFQKVQNWFLQNILSGPTISQTDSSPLIDTRQQIIDKTTESILKKKIKEVKTKK